MPKIGFMFGAGAEMGYGLPPGGTFALNIFRQDPSASKVKFKTQRAGIDKTSRYAQWLPEDYETKNITVFRKKAYEDIIRSTIEQNRENIIKRLNNLDALAADIVSEMSQDNCDINSDFEEVTGRQVSDTYMDREIVFIPEFRDGEAIFKSNYFSSLLKAYKVFRQKRYNEKGELGKIIVSILQLQIGALGEKLTHRLNEGVFDKKDDDLDFLDDLGDIIQLNYQSVGMAGLEYLLEPHETSLLNSASRILCFAQKLIEKVYSSVLDYKSLIDSNWMYLYHPATEWAKFCKIVIFLLNVQNYMNDLYQKLPEGRKGYYDDVSAAYKERKIEISAIGTSNYLPLIESILPSDKITFLNGSTQLWYDPYLNRIGTEEELMKENHFIVPLMFTQSGTKPMISIDMSSRYVKYYEALKEADEICVVGFGFNSDDEHINGLFRDLVDRHQKSLTVICRQGNDSLQTVKKRIAQNLKIQDDSRLTVIPVDNDRKCNGKPWIECLISMAK